MQTIEKLLKRMNCRTDSLVSGIVFLLLTMPIMALAQDADEKPQPLTPEETQQQLYAWAGIALVIVVPIIWYWFRRWQIARSGRVVDGQNRLQD